MAPAGAAEPEDSGRYRVLQAMSKCISTRSRRRPSKLIMAMQGARTVHRALQRPPCEGRGRARVREQAKTRAAAEAEEVKAQEEAA